MAKHKWVLLRGLARESGHWGDFPELLQKQFPQEEVICIDLPGTGSLHTGSCPRHMTDIWQGVRSQVPLDRSIRLLAISLGSMVGMEWLRNKPAELEFCVFINPSARNSGPFYMRLRWQVWREFIKILSLQKPRERERSLLELLMNNPSAREVALPLWTRIALERPISLQCFLNQLFAAATFKGLTQSEKPVLLLSGLGDRLVDPANSQQLHKLWQCSLMQHPWAGHDLPWDDPEWVIASVKKWVSQIETKNS